MKCSICNKEINVNDSYSVTNKNVICEKCASNNKGQINICTGNGNINATQNIKHKKYE